MTDRRTDGQTGDAQPIGVSGLTENGLEKHSGSPGALRFSGSRKVLPSALLQKPPLITEDGKGITPCDVDK